MKSLDESNIHSLFPINKGTYEYKPKRFWLDFYMKYRTIIYTNGFNRYFKKDNLLSLKIIKNILQLFFSSRCWASNNKAKSRES
jgi:hypothetical protein